MATVSQQPVLCVGKLSEPVRNHTVRFQSFQSVTESAVRFSAILLPTTVTEARDLPSGAYALET
jgi:hypothetical protein